MTHDEDPRDEGPRDEGPHAECEREFAGLRIEVAQLRAALVYACFAQHATSRYELPADITLIDGHSVEVTVDMPEFGRVKVGAGKYFESSAGDKHE